MFVASILASNVSEAAAQAVRVLVMLTALVIAIVVILQNAIAFGRQYRLVQPAAEGSPAAPPTLLPTLAVLGSRQQNPARG